MHNLRTSHVYKLIDIVVNSNDDLSIFNVYVYKYIHHYMIVFSSILNIITKIWHALDEFKLVFLSIM